LTTAIATSHVLHIGSGRKTGCDARQLFDYVRLVNREAEDVRVTHLDADARLNPDVVCTLGHEPIPLPDNSVDLIVAWHVLEHVGKQGESAAWFFAWEEMYRVLTPGGFLYGESPYYDSLWAWLDPTHTRAIGEASFAFFKQDNYRHVGNMISPYRIACDFEYEPICQEMPGAFVQIQDPSNERVRNIRFSLQAVKPLKPWWTDARA
jgi:SAM-dependent methyltransferase